MLGINIHKLNGLHKLYNHIAWQTKQIWVMIDTKDYGSLNICCYTTIGTVNVKLSTEKVVCTVIPVVNHD